MRLYDAIYHYPISFIMSTRDIVLDARLERFRDVEWKKEIYVVLERYIDF